MLCLQLHLYANECIVIFLHILSFSSGFLLIFQFTSTKAVPQFLNFSKWHRVVCLSTSWTIQSTKSNVSIIVSIVSCYSTCQRMGGNWILNVARPDCVSVLWSLLCVCTFGLSKPQIMDHLQQNTYYSCSNIILCTLKLRTSSWANKIYKAEKKNAMPTTKHHDYNCNNCNPEL